MDIDEENKELKALLDKGSSESEYIKSLNIKIQRHLFNREVII